LKYLFTLLKVIASLLGLLVAVGTTVLIMDAASIRTVDMTTDQIVDANGDLHLFINVTLTSAAYIFEARDGNLTLYLKTNSGDFVDKDTEIFSLRKGEIKVLSFELIVPKDLVLEVQAGNVGLLMDVYLSFWEAYGNYKLLNLSVKTTVEVSTGG